MEFYIQLGNLMLEMGNEEQAERAYRTAVKTAKREAGEDSGVAGSALAELWFFYDRLARKEEAGQNSRYIKAEYAIIFGARSVREELWTINPSS